MNIHQVLSGASQNDAITNESREFRTLFTRWGWGGSDHAGRIGHGMSDILPITSLEAQPEDVLLIHHSASIPGLDTVLERPSPKLLLYHNITPAEYLWAAAPVVAAQCAAGRAQLATLVEAADVIAAHSAFNARELTALGARHTEVIPVFVDLARLGSTALAGTDAVAGEPPEVLFVGRLSPHKGQAELIRAFSLYRSHRAPAAHLVLVGEPLTIGYTASLRQLAEDLVPGAVAVESGLSDDALADRYRAADAFVCLSEHEGFCVPLLEAFHAGLPVIARGSGAIPEVVGEAALLVEDRDPAVIAELIHLVVSDRDLRSELIRRGQLRLERFARAPMERKLREVAELTAVARH